MILEQNNWCMWWKITSQIYYGNIEIEKNFEILNLNQNLASALIIEASSPNKWCK